ncbi:branched-chain amino acid ABC transporter permease [Kallotenue papyrolyticum]|uniref:branched-chain amino acid ABC transporter permease n=1 Tax=Kallotenue papyrolyticum TaxID=1325125 RepID=UPI0004B770CC|nr:branched-chain amino acid ABC transporter permease [Kallotenue papyrolyticum]
MATTLARPRWRIDVTQLIVWTIGGILLALIVIGSISTLAAGRYTREQWLDFIIFGLAQGGIYALIALGYTMVYGVLRLINFAHGEVFMSGAFTTYFLADALARRGVLNSYPLLSLVALLLFSALISTMVALAVERVAYRPLRRAPRLVPLITAIGASFFLQYTFRGLYGSGVKVYPPVPLLDGTVFGIQRSLIVVFVCALIMLGLLYMLIQFTKTGRAIRAVSEDLETAALMGVDVDRTIATTFAVGAAMAGVAGVLYALVFRQVQFYMGFVPGIKAFTAAVLGGIGNLPGAALGGLFLGVFESIGPSLFLDGLGIRAAHQMKDVIAFTMLVLILIFRPTGILGERLATKRA